MTLDLEQSIRERAHAIWEREGRPEGRAVLHWDMARRELEPAGEAAPVAPREKAAPKRAAAATAARPTRSRKSAE